MAQVALETDPDTEWLLNEAGKGGAASGSAAPQQGVSIETDPDTEWLLSEAKGKPTQAASVASSASPAPMAPKAPETASKPLLSVPDDLGGTGYAEAAAKVLSSGGAAIIGGWRGLQTLASGGSVDEAAKAVEQEQRDRTYQPQTEVGKKASAAIESPYNPLNWVPIGATKAGNATLAATGSPAAATAVETGINALPALLMRGQGAKPVSLLRDVNPSIAATAKPAAVAEATPGMTPTPSIPPELPAYMRKAEAANAPEMAAAETPKATSAPAPEVAPKVAGVDASITTPVQGKAAAIEYAPDPTKPVASPLDLPEDVQTSRAEILKDGLGLDKIRKSALTGNVLEGATDAQITKINEPAGHQMLQHFTDEYNALTNKGSQIVSENGGRVGLNDKSLYATGDKISAPVDALEKWYDKASRKLYTAADQKSKGLPVVQTEPIHAILDDPSFVNGVMADDKLGLLKGIKSQLELFEKNNPGGLTVSNAEEFRQFINKRWKHDNASILEPIKEAIDDAVTKSAGEDVYNVSRQMWQQKKATINNPKGMARLFEKDPNDPLSRRTPNEKIPATLLDKLSIDQFNGVIDTLRNKMPDELKPQADAAIKAIKAHVGNELIEAGQPNTKTTTPFWNNRRVNDYLDSHGEKIATLFSDDPEGIKNIHTLRAGGNILAVDAAYPGAAAQGTNLVKQGLVSRLITPAATSAGGAVGSLFGPGGAASGAWAGRFLGEKASAARSQAAALKKVGRRVVPLGRVGK
jgi:hypothetical protein